MKAQAYQIDGEKVQYRAISSRRRSEGERKERYVMRNAF
jgi:hypothetical protein